ETSWPAPAEFPPVSTVTRYFRATYTPAAGEYAIRITIKTDVGFRVFLNGVKILQWGLPEGEITPATYATNSTEEVEDYVVSTTLAISGSTSQAIVGVEVHASEDKMSGNETFSGCASFISNAKERLVDVGGSYYSYPEETYLNEGVDKLFDSNVNTKWCLLSSKNPFTPWVVWSFGDRHWELMNQYELATANDMPYRDCRFWKMYGSMDEIEWVLLDERVDVKWTYRFERKEFTMDNYVAYRAYKWECTHVDTWSYWGYSMQMSEWNLLLTDQPFIPRPTTLPPTTLPPTTLPPTTLPPTTVVPTPTPIEWHYSNEPQSSTTWTTGETSWPAPAEFPPVSTVTRCFRTTLTPEAGEYAIRITIKTDVGFRVFLNGVKILQWGLPEGEITPATYATNSTEEVEDYVISTTLAISGSTSQAIVGVEVHASEDKMSGNETFSGHVLLISNAKERLVDVDGSYYSYPQKTGVEGTGKLFDDDVNTKWCLYHYSEPFTPWVVWSFGDRHWELMNQYELVTANDVPERDCRSWKIYGSMDEIEWVLLDERVDVTWRYRFERKEFTMDNYVAYRAYKWECTSVILTPDWGYAFQMSEWNMLLTDQPFIPRPTTLPPTTLPPTTLPPTTLPPTTLPPTTLPPTTLPPTTLPPTTLPPTTLPPTTLPPTTLPPTTLPPTTLPPTTLPPTTLPPTTLPPTTLPPTTLPPTTLPPTTHLPSVSSPHHAVPPLRRQSDRFRSVHMH
ncbi:hypothetical protein BLSTO_05129, partial [Blastocystis sp. subtype 1]